MKCVCYRDETATGTKISAQNVDSERLVLSTTCLYGYKLPGKHRLITEALQHCRGVGPVRLAQLHEAGVRSWQEAVAEAGKIPLSLRHEVTAECKRCLQALEEDNIQYFVDRLHPPDRWRILHRYLERCTFFDIETTGLECDDTITLIICYHENELHTFVEHENLDDFLDLLDEVHLLVSFNGSTFDVPRLLDGFHILELPCPHLDLRWPCYYRNLNGGLKQIMSQFGVERPDDLLDSDGSLAVQLWNQWRNHQDQSAREHLIRYCAADVLLLRPLAGFLSQTTDLEIPPGFWEELPAASGHVPVQTADQQRKQFLASIFGTASPTKLRTRRRA